MRRAPARPPACGRGPGGGTPATGNLGRVLFIATIAALLTACGDDDEIAVPEPTPEPAPPAPIVAGRPIADTAAFALVPTSEGALLVWGAPIAQGSGVRAIRLGPLGEALDVERAVTTGGEAGGGATEQRVPQAVEVAAASDGRAIGIAWVVDRGRELVVQAARSPDGGRRFADAEALGATVRRPAGQGGRLSVVADDRGTFVVHHRVPDGDCVNSEGRCARIDRRTIGEGDLAEAVRDTSVEEVPNPCEPLVAGALFREGSWYYALCAADPDPATHVFVIDPDPPLATPVAVDPGCVPIGLGPLDRGVAAVTRCGDDVSAVVLDERGDRVAALRPVERVVGCEQGRPVLQLKQGDRVQRLRLGAALGHLEPLLPEAIAPPGSRAVWTGEALLVAVPAGRELSLRRYQCEGSGRFDRTDSL